MPDRSITVRLQAVVSDFERSMGQAASSTRAFTSDVATMSRNNRAEMQTVGTAAVGFGAVVAAGFAVAGKAAIDWESAFTGVRKTVDASEAELAGLAAGFRDLATEIPVSAGELAGIGEAAGQLGIETENILGFTKTIAELGVTTNLASDQAATAFARIANIMETPQDQFDEMGSTVVALGNNLATTESEITDFALRIAGAGHIAGLTEPDIFAIAAAMSSVGVEAEAGGTAVQKVLLDMSESVSTGSDNLETFARVAGMSSDEFSQRWRDDAGGAFASFVEGLGAAGTDAFGILDELGLKDQRLIRSFLSLAGAGDLMTESLELSNKAYEENTALSDEAALRFSTVESQLIMAKNAAVEMAIAFGDVLLPVLTPVIGLGRDVMLWIADLPGPAKTAAAAIGGVAGAVALTAGGLLLLVPRIVATIDALRVLRATAAGVKIAGLLGGGLGVAATVAAVGGAVVGGGIAGGLAAEVLPVETKRPGTDRELAAGTLAGGFAGGLASGLLARNRREMADEAAAAEAALQGLSSEELSGGVAHRLGEVRVAADTAGASIGGMAAQSKSLAERLAEVTEEGESLSSTMLGVVNPVAQARDAIEDLAEKKETVDKLTEEGKWGTEEWSTAMLDFAVATVTAQAAMDVLNAQGVEITADSMAKALGVPRDVAEQILTTLGILDGSEFKTYLTIHERLESAVRGGSAPRAQFGSLGRRAGGGPVDAGTSYWVGERGPEVFMPAQPGVILNDAMLAKLAQSSTSYAPVVNLYGVPDPAAAAAGVRQALALDRVLSGV